MSRFILTCSKAGTFGCVYKSECDIDDRYGVITDNEVFAFILLIMVLNIS